MFPDSIGAPLPYGGLVGNKGIQNLGLRVFPYAKYMMYLGARSLGPRGPYLAVFLM